jgi:hypothetical protein
MTRKKDSPAIQLLRLVWENCNTAIRHSYERINHAMYEATRLAIGSGFRFDDGDFAVIDKDFLFCYWGGADNAGFAESLYSLACASGNTSAAQAFESWKERGPVIADGVDYGEMGRMFRHGGGQVARGRLCAGSRFVWNREYVTVTSLASDPTRVVACSYKDDSRSKILHRYTITPAMIKADRAARK